MRFTFGMFYVTHYKSCGGHVIIAFVAAWLLLAEPGLLECHEVGTALFFYSDYSRWNGHSLATSLSAGARCQLRLRSFNYFFFTRRFIYITLLFRLWIQLCARHPAF
ncbi:MAG: hypothetical protein H6669_05435 [Ardenticatenaceae bacterium]|nr:hypothetical protein [Ardenticatenaceae bacterium]